jgi:hypothetical protein
MPDYVALAEIFDFNYRHKILKTIKKDYLAQRRRDAAFLTTYLHLYNTNNICVEFYF